MRSSFLSLSAVFVFLIATSAIGQTPNNEPLPLAKVLTPVTAEFDSKDLNWLKLGGEIVASVLVDKKGKVTIIDLTGPDAPCSDLSNDRLVSLRTAATDAVKKSKFQPAMDKDGNPVDGGLRIRLKLPARDPDKGLEGGGLVSNPKLVVGGVINGKAIYLAHPQYPSEARANHATGAVSVQVLIDEKGKVIAAGATNGNPYLRYAAAEAACSSKFSPTLLSGQPVKVSGVITYNFMQ